MNRASLKLIVRLLLAPLFIVAGVLHFTHTESYLAIMPPYLPFHRALVYLSGFFEIIGGASLLVPSLARAASFGLIALLLAVLPANIHMAINDVQIGATRFSPLLLWLRVPLQFLLIALVWWCTKEAQNRERSDAPSPPPRG